MSRERRTTIRLSNRFLISLVPLIIGIGFVIGIATFFLSKSGYTRYAVERLQIVSFSIAEYSEEQWNILDLSRTFVGEATSGEALENAAIESIRTRSIAYLDPATDAFFVHSYANDNNPIILPELPESDTGEEVVIEFPSKEEAINLTEKEWEVFKIGEIEYLGYIDYIPLNDWFIFIGTESKAFYADINRVTFINILVIALASGALILAIIFTTRVITNNIGQVSSAMGDIIQNGDFSQKVPIEYKDEVGQLANTFNFMLGELENTYREIRRYAFNAVVAQKEEQKLRTVFQKYVPSDVINTMLEKPEALLLSDNKEVGVFFSDIRSFTNISEATKPDELVNDLNVYFGLLVESITECGGVIDKYIGDAVMALFGAPVFRGNEPTMALFAALEIQEKLGVYNKQREENGKIPFKTGIGIHFGLVTVGNIGTEKKMDYTVIGDAVNFSSRLEGLTKYYQSEVLFSRTIFQAVNPIYPTRFVDLVQVKGKSQGEGIYTTKKNIERLELDSWKLYHEGINRYFDKDFTKAKDLFQRTLSRLPGDFLSETYIERCDAYLSNPPPKDWNGVTAFDKK